MPAMPCQDPWFSATADRLPLRQPASPPPHPRSPALVLEETGLHRVLGVKELDKGPSLAYAVLGGSSRLGK